jgi:hypothetical protein
MQIVAERVGGVTLGNRLVGSKTELSPEMRELWGYITTVHYLILATPGFIVFLDEALEIDWKTTQDHDAKRANEREQRNMILTRAAELESGDWDGDRQQTLNLKRQIAEAIARAFEGNFAQADQMLAKASSYRISMRRRQAINTQAQIKEEWRSSYRRWISLHYVIGILALVLSTLVASKPSWIGAGDNGIGILSWLVAVFTGLLTFLTPGKKADKYLRAWSVLNTEITRYNADESYTVNDVLEACQRGENIIFEIPAIEKRRR